MQFLSTPSARRATPLCRHDSRCILHFYPRPPRGGRRPRRPRMHRWQRISIHALREEGDHYPQLPPHHRKISIHALREEGDLQRSGHDARHFDFYPRPPRGGRPTCSMYSKISGDFYPRPPRGGRQRSFWRFHLICTISIHALREEGDRGPHLTAGGKRISIHALREEGDRIGQHVKMLDGDFYPRPPRGGRPNGLVAFANGYIFLSTPSARRATHRQRAGRHPESISIHALREEGDDQSRGLHSGCIISIHALREEGDLQPVYGRHRFCQISIHALREEGDCRTWCTAWRTAYFYPRPPRGGRPQQEKLLKDLLDFYPRPPRGGRPSYSSCFIRPSCISIHALREEGD